MELGEQPAAGALLGTGVGGFGRLAREERGQTPEVALDFKRSGDCPRDRPAQRSEPLQQAQLVGNALGRLCPACASNDNPRCYY